MSVGNELWDEDAEAPVWGAVGQPESPLHRRPSPMLMPGRGGGVACSQRPRICLHVDAPHQHFIEKKNK
jgi:hypothetical protein